MNKKAQMNGVVMFIVAFIALIGVAIPISQSVVTSANLTGMTKTIVEFVPVFLGLGGLVLAVSIYSRR
jgi:hypothetical protein